MLVTNVTNKNGNAVANQFIKIDNENLIQIFQSYKSDILIFDYKNCILTFGKNWNYSKTTAKYRNQILTDAFGMDITTKDCEKMIFMGCAYNTPFFKDWEVRELY
jgi:hypothetical protein